MNQDMCLESKCACYEGENNEIEMDWRNNYDVSYTYIYNRTTATQPVQVYQRNGQGFIYSLKQLDWAYNGFSKFNDCYDKVLSIDQEFKSKDVNGFFSGNAYKFLLEIEQNYTAQHGCLNICPGIDQLFYLGVDLKDGIARSSFLPEKNKDGCLKHMVAPAYTKLDDLIKMMFDTLLVVLPSFIFAFPSCTPYDNSSKGKLYRAEDIEKTVINDEVRERDGQR